MLLCALAVANPACAKLWANTNIGLALSQISRESGVFDDHGSDHFVVQRLPVFVEQG